MLNPKQVIIQFMDDEEAQATTEYILMLSIVTSFAVLIIKNLIKPAMKKLTGAVSKQLNNLLLGADLHTFRVH